MSSRMSVNEGHDNTFIDRLEVTAFSLSQLLYLMQFGPLSIHPGHSPSSPTPLSLELIWAIVLICHTRAIATGTDK